MPIMYKKELSQQVITIGGENILILKRWSHSTLFGFSN